jgi:hypothetical protein
MLQKAIALATLALVAATTSLWLMKAPAQSAPVTLVPLAFADERGASAWSSATRDRFQKDTANQWPLTDTEKQARGGRNPLAWLPSLEQCRYISRFVDVMQRYGLDSNDAEMQRLREQRQRCYTQFQ